MANSPLTKSFPTPHARPLSAICSTLNSVSHPPDLSSITSDAHVESVARYFGGNGYKADEATTKRIYQSITAASQRVTPRATYSLFPISRILPGGAIVLEDGETLQLPDCFSDSGASVVAAAIGTLGERLENYCRELSGCGKIYESTLFDAIGTTFLDLLSDRLCSTLEDIGRDIGLAGGDRYAPGIDGYPLEKQHQLFQMADSTSVGVGLNSSAIMMPAKSISFFMILTKTPHRHSGKDKCTICRLAHCQYRATGPKKNFNK
jgi:hypothetical protein